MLTAWLDPAAASQALLLAYVVALNVTLFLSGMALVAFCSRYQSAALRANVWGMALLGVLGVTLLWWLPGGSWVASSVPDGLAAPMVALGAAGMAAGASEGASALRWIVLLRFLWLAGALFVSGRLLWGWMVIRASSRRAEPVRDSEWLTLLQESAAELGVRRCVELRRTFEVATPLTWGTLRPVILLPAEMEEWSQAHRRAVLLHELAHVKRFDCPLQVLGQLACALYWFHPAVWWIAGRLQIVREMACDAEVLGAGVRASDYAECLLSMAECARLDGARGSVAVAVGMARPSRLKERMISILQPCRTRSSALRRAATGLSTVGLMLLFGHLHLSPRSEMLRSALSADEWSTRAFAAEALSWRGKQDPALAEAARRVAENDPHPAVRQAAQRD